MVADLRILALCAAMGLGFADAMRADPVGSSPRPLTRPSMSEVVAIATLAAKPVVTRIIPRPRPGSSSINVGSMAAISVPGLRPRSRPSAAQRPLELVQVAAVTRATAIAASVRPPERPENLRRLSQAKAVGYRVQPVPTTKTGRKGAVCGDPAIRGTKIPRIKARIRGCGLKNGVKVTSVAGVALSTPVSIDCTTAKALNFWVKNGVIPAVGRLGGGAAQLQVAAGYSCRTRNNVKGAKISEHGRGRAVDISGIVLANGTTVSVLKGWGKGRHGKILKSVRKVACGPFTTVLGPGSDRHHRDHFHIDTARGRGPYCR